MTPGYLQRGIPAPYALPVSLAAFLAIGTVAAALRDHMTSGVLLITCALVAGLVSFAAEPVASVLIAAAGWLTVAGFSRPPYADLNPTAAVAVDAAITVGSCSLACACLGILFRRHASKLALAASEPRAGRRAGGMERGGRPPGVMSGRRQLAGVLLAAAGLPLITVLLTAGQRHLNLADDLLAYLVLVVLSTVTGGFWPAVTAAAAAGLLLNWFFTRPYHALTIQQPQDLLALLLFVTVAAAAASVVHLAARRAAQAAASRAEAASLLGLAQTVLGGADTAQAVLDHLTRSHGGHAELAEKTAGCWVPAASSGDRAQLAATRRIDIRPGLMLRVTGQAATAVPSLLAGYAAQAAAALDRQRVRAQAAQAEALAEGSRTRTALLEAVSHDLRTPLAAVKASISSLRQADVQWSPADQAELLATIEHNTGRLDALIGNLLDMSRLNAGSLQPFLRPVAIGEVAAAALPGPGGSPGLTMDVPDDFPLILADPGLLERILANLFSNALRHSPPSRPPELHARAERRTVALDVADHGPGVPDERKQRIFEPFTTSGDRRSGTGLGLAVAKGLAEAMGGSVTALDTPGGGLTVRVTLPAVSSGKTALGTA